MSLSVDRGARRQGQRRQRDTNEPTNTVSPNQGLQWIKPVQVHNVSRVEAAGQFNHPAQSLPIGDYGVGNHNLNTNGTGNPMGEYMRDAEIFLGKPTSAISTDPFMAYPQESHDLPHAFLGHRPQITQLVIQRFLASDRWILQLLLPLRAMTNPNGGTYTQVIFDNHMLTRLAYQTTGRNVTNHQKSKRFTSSLYGINQTLERGFWLQEMGRKHWAMGIVQMSRATEETMCLMAMTEVLTMTKPVTTIEEERGMAWGPANFETLESKRVLLWDIIKKVRNGIDVAADIADQVFLARKQTGSKTLVLCAGAGRFIAATDERTKFTETGIPRAAGNPWDSPDNLRVKYMDNTRESRPFVTGGSEGNIDPTYRYQSIGGAFYHRARPPTVDIYETKDGSNGPPQCKFRTEHADVYRYFDGSDAMECVRFADSFRNSCMYTESGEITVAGAFVFSTEIGVKTNAELRRELREMRPDGDGDGSVARDDSSKYSAGSSGSLSTGGDDDGDGADGKSSKSAPRPRSGTSKTQRVRYDEWKTAIGGYAQDPKTFVSRASLVGGDALYPDGKECPKHRIHTVRSFYLCHANGQENISTIRRVIVSRGPDTWRALHRVSGSLRASSLIPLATASSVASGAPAGSGGGAGGATGPSSSSSSTSTVSSGLSGDAARAAYANPDALNREIDEYLGLCSLETRAYWDFALAHHIPFLMSIQGSVPDMTYEAGTCIVAMPGLGFTEAGFGDYTIAFQALTKMYAAAFRINIGVNVISPERAVLLPNVFVRRYIGGNANAFYSIKEVEAYRRGDRSKSMFAFLLWPGFDGGNMKFFDKSGRFSNAFRTENEQKAPIFQLHYCTADIYRRIWGFRPTERKLDATYREQSKRENSICHQEFQLMYNRNGEPKEYRTGSGDWGPFAQTGDAMYRLGQATGRVVNRYMSNSQFSEIH